MQLSSLFDDEMITYFEIIERKKAFVCQLQSFLLLQRLLSSSFYPHLFLAVLRIDIVDNNQKCYIKGLKPKRINLHG